MDLEKLKLLADVAFQITRTLLIMREIVQSVPSPINSYVCMLCEQVR